MPDTCHIVIPARYNSSRLPGKPLKLIAGKPMIERVYRQAQKTAISSICVATDDTRIQQAVEAFGGQVVMTREDHQSGTDRLAEVCEKQGWDDNDIVLNLQGDEPLIPPGVIQLLAQLASDSQAPICTLATPIQAEEDIFNPNVVKVVLDNDGKAHYFSRAPIPWDRDRFQRQGTTSLSSSEDTIQGNLSAPYYRHLGLYAYRVKTLKAIPRLAPCVIEQAESLEQLRPLYHGIAIQVGIIDDAPHHGVDTEEDLLRVSAFFTESAAE